MSRQSSDELAADRAKTRRGKMTRYKIDPWYSERPGLIDNLVIALRRSGYTVYAENANEIVTDAGRPALLLASGYGQLLVTARS